MALFVLRAALRDIHGHKNGRFCVTGCPARSQRTWWRLSYCHTGKNLDAEPEGVEEAGVALIVEVRALGVKEAFSE